jgi:hypothetical protein
MPPEGSPLFVERWRASRSQGLFLILHLSTFEIQWPQEAPLPHSARAIVFWNVDTACFAYSPTEYAIFSIPTMSAVEIVTPLPLSGPGTAMNALTGLTGYMTLGRGAKAKPTVVQVAGSEILLGKDGEHVFLCLSVIVSTTPGEGLFIGTDGKLSRPATIEWPVPPEEIGEFSPFPSLGHAYDLFIYVQLSSNHTYLLPFPPVRYRRSLWRHLQPLAHKCSLHSILQRSYKSDPLYHFQFLKQSLSHSIILNPMRLRMQA